MEKYPGIINPSYHFTDKHAELPDYLLKEIEKALHIDWSREELVASCWIHNMFMKGKVFVVITNLRVAFSDTLKIRQNLFADMTGVERNFMKNIELLSPGNSTKLFSSSDMPVEKLRSLLFDIINTTWIKSRQAKSAAAQPSAATVPAQIEQLNELKNKGILTEEEFHRKKTELLAKM
jgi:hypothetical protein